MDKSSRVLYLWRTEVEEQRERASDIRRRNEALVYNILPPHVAKHFLGSYKRQHEELYSQSYAEVGVLFASMPNFSGTFRPLTLGATTSSTNLKQRELSKRKRFFYFRKANTIFPVLLSKVFGNNGNNFRNIVRNQQRT